MTPADQFSPQPGDALLTEGPVFLDSVEVQAAADQAGTALVHLKGSLPSPCHGLRAQVSLSDANDRITLDVYSVSNPDRMCAGMIVPFDAIVPVSGLIMDRKYTLLVNDEEKLRFEWPLP